MSTAIFALIALAAVPLVSYLVEALRRRPVVPQRLGWAPDIPVRWIEGSRLRYIVAGSGPPVVLLHTLRTQLDIFQKVIPALSRRFRVYALDYPGHGYSDIPDAEYSPELFVKAAAGFLDALDIAEGVVVGESIGGTIGLLLAARGGARGIRQHRRAGAVAVRRPRLVARSGAGRRPVGHSGGAHADRARGRALSFDRRAGRDGPERSGVSGRAREGGLKTTTGR